MLRHQILIFCSGGNLPEQPHVNSLRSLPVNTRAKTAGLDVLVPKPGTEVNLGQIICSKFITIFKNI